jgi:hypothetical protein
MENPNNAITYNLSEGFRKIQDKVSRAAINPPLQFQGVPKKCVMKLREDLFKFLYLEIQYKNKFL